jgi:hypothetical protein
MRKNTIITTLYLAAVVCVVAPLAHAKTFSNQFIEFQLPEKWECMLDGTEWICQSTDEEKKRDAIIVLAAKLKKEGMDSLEIYEAHLKEKLTYTTANKEQITSDPRYVKRLDISGKTWIDSLHLASEIPDFYTRYLATVEADIGILLTFSVRKDKYNLYAPDIEALVQSLRAFRKPGALNEDPNKLGAEDSSQQTASNLMFGEDGAKKGGAAGGGQANQRAELILFGLVGVIAVAYILWRKRKR